MFEDWKMITALAGGVGAARFLQGLVKNVLSEKLTIIVNTGDDIEFHGLHVSPDLDIVMYTLAGIVDEEKGWGIKNDTFNCLKMLTTYGQKPWFNLGDKDLATSIERTRLLGEGHSLSEVTGFLCKSFKLKMRLLPMTDAKFGTMILTDKGKMHFEEYMVKRGAEDKVLGVEFEPVEAVMPATGVIDAIMQSTGVVICPSNPIVSIGTILSIKNVRDALKKTRATIVGVSPIIGGATVKGPADKLMRGLGLEVSAYGVASLYKDFLDGFVIDSLDRNQKKQIEKLGIRVQVTNTAMKNIDDKTRLAKTVLDMIANQ
jgi:LPPG:FO 2-phospho-L-lactate transferase